MAGPPWRVFFYRDADGNREFLAEFNWQPAAVRARFLSRLRYLVTVPRHDWKRPCFGHLKREGRGLGEVRFEINHVPHRPLGFFSADDAYSFLIWATEKDSQLRPSGVVDEAQRRKDAMINDSRRGHEFTVG